MASTQRKVAAKDQRTYPTDDFVRLASDAALRELLGSGSGGGSGGGSSGGTSGDSDANDHEEPLHVTYDEYQGRSSLVVV